jgi:hypothetical protein
MRCQIYEDAREYRLLPTGLSDGLGDSGAGRVTVMAFGGLDVLLQV